MASMQDALGEELQLVFDLRMSNYFITACYIALLYDTIETLPQEIELIWPAKWNFGKILYFVNRYPVLVELSILISYITPGKIGKDACLGISYADSWSFVMLLLPVQAVLVLRTYALWNRDLRILTMLSFVVAATFGINLWYIIGLTTTRVYIPDPIPTILGCITSSSAGSDSPMFNRAKTSLPFLSLAAFDSSIFILTALRIFLHFRRPGEHFTPLLRVLLRDGFLYYVILLASSIVTIIVVFTLPPQRIAIVSILPYTIRTLMSIFSSRIILNLRGIPSRRICTLTLVGELGGDDPIEEHSYERAGLTIPTFSSSGDGTTMSECTTGQSQRSDYDQLRPIATIDLTAPVVEFKMSQSGAKMAMDAEAGQTPTDLEMPVISMQELHSSDPWTFSSVERS